MKKIKIKKVGLFVVGLFAMASLHAEDFTGGNGVSTYVAAYNYITWQNATIENSVALTNLKKISFTSSQMIFTNADGTSQSVALSGLKKMFFSSVPTGITVLDGAQSLSIVYDDASQSLLVNGNEGMANLQIYNANGGAVRSIALGASNSSTSLSSLPRGIYIAKIHGRTLKFCKR